MQPNEWNSIALTKIASSVVTNFERHGKEKMRGDVEDMKISPRHPFFEAGTEFSCKNDGRTCAIDSHIYLLMIKRYGLARWWKEIVPGESTPLDPEV